MGSHSAEPYKLAEKKEGIDDSAVFNVLVTGFGPFKSEYPINPSWEIAASLPSYLPVPSAKFRCEEQEGVGVSSQSSSSFSSHRPKKVPAVRIFVHPAPVRVSYRVVRSLVPKLWECTATREDSCSAGELDLIQHIERKNYDKGNKTFKQIYTTNSSVSEWYGRDSTDKSAEEERRKEDENKKKEGSQGRKRTPDRKEDGPPLGTRIDLVVHVGMAGPRLVYSMERLGHRNGYAMPDVDGEFVNDEYEHHDRDDKNWSDYKEKERPSFGAQMPSSFSSLPSSLPSPSPLPETLFTAFDTLDVFQRWKQQVPPGTDLRLSNDPGRYLCDYIYFSSLAHLYERQQKKRVVFLHVPSDVSPEAIARGRAVTLGLVRALVESYLDVGY